MALILLCVIAGVSTVVLCAQAWISFRILIELQESKGKVELPRFFEREWL